MRHLTIILFVLVMAAVIATSATADTVYFSDNGTAGAVTGKIDDSPLRGDIDQTANGGLGWNNANIGQNGGDAQWRIFADSAPNKRHNLMKFDLSSLAGATINSATLGVWIRVNSAPDAVTGFQISRLQAGKNWVEGTDAYANPAFAGDPTWNSQAHGSTLWATAGATGGADIDLSTSISWDISGSPSEYRTWDISDFVQDWVSGSWENNGMLFWGGTESADTTSNYYWGYLTETTNVTRRPYLVIDYTVPEPSSLIALAGFGLAGLGFMRRRRS